MNVNEGKNKTPNQARSERWRLDRLKPNRLQSRYFRDLSAYDLTALAANILLRGLRQPIEALPDGTVLDGHMRLKALRLNGATHTDVLVRYDLADAPDAERERAFIETNVLRRQLTPIAKARAVYGLFLVEKGQRPGARLYGGDEAEARDRVGRAIGMSGRNLTRYLNVLAAPKEVQDAFERGEIRLVDAARVATLSRADQERLAARLRAGETPKAVFAEFFPPTGGRHVKPADAVASFARVLEAAAADLADRLAEVRPGTVQRNEEPLRAGARLLDRLLRKLEPAG